MDVLSASYFDNTIALYINDGDENFTELIVSSTAEGAYSVYSTDLDNDGDKDILSASGLDDKIAWYENDGAESFTEHVISTTADAAHAVYALDVNGDGDMDVLSASLFDNKIAWYENDGTESFTEHVITTDANGAYDVFAIDLDNDSDIDVLSASYSDNKIAWYENDGDENFTAHTVSISASSARSVYAYDMDTDGDLDLLSASYGDDKVAWYENDGTESFTEHTITLVADGAYSAYPIDMDGDTDIDVIAASNNDNSIAWYENDGTESFTEHVITVDAINAHYTFAADVDGDSDIDVLSASYGDDQVDWYENTTCIPTASTAIISACDAYTWIDGNTYTEDEFEATHTLINAEGCDSVITLNLTINSSNSGTETVTACVAFTWIDGITYTEDEFEATYTLSNIHGCDSVVTLNLTINNVDNTTSISGSEITSNTTTADTYQWVNCDNAFEPIDGENEQSFSPSDNGNYAVIITENGCTDTSSCVLIDFLGLDVIANQLSSVYPNPIQEHHFFVSSAAIISEVKVFDLLGKEIQIVFNPNSLMVSLPPSVASGKYITHIITDNGNYQKINLIVQ